MPLMIPNRRHAAANSSYLYKRKNSAPDEHPTAVAILGIQQNHPVKASYPMMHGYTDGLLERRLKIQGINGC